MASSAASPIDASSSFVHDLMNASPFPKRNWACGSLAGGSNFAPWSDRPDPHERLDRPTLVHGGVGLGDPLQVGLEVEDPAGIDAALQDIVEQLGDVHAHRSGAAAQT